MCGSISQVLKRKDVTEKLFITGSWLLVDSYKGPQNQMFQKKES